MEVSHLTKEYRLGALQGLKQTRLNAGARIAGQQAPQRPLFKALDDVSFAVEPGEVVGIIGHNGAEKSTLLKMLARTSTPTRGCVEVNGRIPPLIEVGAGFVPDFTGCENVYPNGSILGMSRKQIDAKFDEIVDFAEMAAFIDTPVKRYSSGMQVKLAFAVVTSVKSEILIVDEVLAVGDLAFQRKCFDRMEELIKQQRRTVLLVSHNIRQVQRMCSRVILLRQGHILNEEPSAPVCDQFYRLSNDTIHATALRKQRGPAVSSDEIESLVIDIVDEHGQPVGEILEGDALRIRVRLTVRAAIDEVEFHVGTHTTDFIYLTGESSRISQPPHDLAPGVPELTHVIDAYPLVPGSYGIRFAVIDERGRVVFYGEGLSFFQVRPGRSDASFKDELRLISTPSRWHIASPHALAELG